MDEQGSISPSFYEQLLHAKITKAQKYSNDLTVFSALLGSMLIIATRNHVGEIAPSKRGRVVCWWICLVYKEKDLKKSFTFVLCNNKIFSVSSKTLFQKWFLMSYLKTDDGINSYSISDLKNLNFNDRLIFVSSNFFCCYPSCL